MRTIHKLALCVDELPARWTFCTHADHEVLSVNEQNGDVCVWVGVDTANAQKELTLWYIGTGQEIPSDKALEYLGTAHISQGCFVVHVYKEI